ncbi:MAG: glycosyltransferase family 4 protein [Spirochaetia bacterium]|nr:glycosyltransferase family 4 protein [Spirochaetia bacterium]
MKILITTDLYKPFVNGVITSIDALVSQLENKGHDIKIITLSNTHHSYTVDNVTYLGAIDLNIIYPGAKFKLSIISKELRAIYNWKPDIIHSQCEFSTFLVARRISKKFNLPIIHTYHTIYEDYTHYFLPNEKFGHIIAAKFSSHVLNQCDNVIAPTKKVEKLLSSYNILSPISIIPTGIDLSKFTEEKDVIKIQTIKRNLGISENNFIIGFVGRVAKEKNLDELFDIYNKIEKDNITLMIVGDGPYKEELIKKSKTIKKQIVFTSMIEPKDIHHYYKCFDIFMSCSSSETQGLTYIEALSSSIPILCKKDPCLEKVVIDSINGWQFENHEEAITTFNKFYGDINMRKTMSNNAQVLSIINFSSSAFCEKVLNLYNTTIEEYNKYKRA